MPECKKKQYTIWLRTKPSESPNSHIPEHFYSFSRCHSRKRRKKKKAIVLSHIFVWSLNSSNFASAYIMSVQFSHVRLFDPMNHSSPGLPVYHQLPEFTQTHVHRVGDAIQPSHPLSCPSPPAPNPFQHQGLFQWVNSSHEVAKVLEFQLQRQSFQWTPGLISFRMDWLDLLAVQGTLKSLLQHHGSKASILRRSASFTVQLSHPYMTTGKTIALTRRTFVGNVSAFEYAI